MAVVTLNSRTLAGTALGLTNNIVAVTSDNAAVNRPHRYAALEIEVCSPSAGDTGIASRPGPDQPLTVPAAFTALATWSAARIAEDVAIDTAAASWAI